MLPKPVFWVRLFKPPSTRLDQRFHVGGTGPARGVTQLTPRQPGWFQSEMLDGCLRFGFGVLSSLRPLCLLPDPRRQPLKPSIGLNLCSSFTRCLIFATVTPIFLARSSCALSS